MKLGNKIILMAAAGVVLATLGSIATVYWISHGNRVQELRGAMSATIQQAETVIANMDEMHRGGAFQPLRVEKGKDIRTNIGYKAIPVVAGWESVKPVAHNRGFEFFTPTRPGIPARNPKNQMPEFDAAFAAFSRGEEEFFVEDSENQKLILARPVRLRETCLQCHGDPAKSPTRNGLDPLGMPMENMKQGDIKGALVLKATMAQDAVVMASIGKISLVGLVILGIVTGGFWYFNRLLILRPVERIVGMLAGASGEVGSASGSVASASTQLAQQASQQAAALEETSASSEEISSMISRNAEYCNSALETMRAAQQEAQEGTRALSQMDASMKEIADSSAAISRIIKVIDGIAFQTNILALNAAVEAARAGEAGLGFSVVADEVRTLAQSAAQAARETASLIEQSSAASATGGQNMARLAEAIHQLTQKTEEVHGVLAEVASASGEQSSGIRQITTSMTQLDRLTQSTAASAQEGAAASQELTSQAQALGSVVQELRELMGVG